jgi:hypothetical protein
MPNPAWDDPSTLHVFHPPLHAPTPSAPDLGDLTLGADTLRQMIEAAENMGDDSDDQYSEPAVLPLSRRRIALSRDQLNLEGLNDAQLAIVDRWFVIDVVPEDHKARCRMCVIGAFRRAGIVVGYDPTHNARVAPMDRTQASNIRHWNLDKTRIRFDTLGNTDN